ncbi:U3 small nucleolar ribonucleoprotein protein MPP10 [Prorops nasuta]|uniref:U3 small nucleolar ribonucleoprotein protein MPP10 n=1 Tax=Prorops nasuta TaxID=863751 RepID=UPI0034CE9DA2
MRAKSNLSFHTMGDTISDVLLLILNKTQKPEEFLSVQNETAHEIRSCIKQLYDFTKTKSERNKKSLPELLIDGFDEEQIWQQLELQNEGELDYLIGDISKVLAAKDELTLPISLVPNQSKHKDEVEAVGNDNDSDSVDEESVHDINLEDYDSELTKKISKAKKQNKKSSIVDDKFFKLQELDEYLTKEDKKETGLPKSSGESDDESVDLFNDFSNDEDEEEEKDPKYVKYADFFDSPDSEAENNDSKLHENDDMDYSDNEQQSLQSEDEDHKKSSKKVKFNLTNDSDETDSLEKADPIEENREIKSSLESRQERLGKRIKEMEDQAISEKPWQLKGEVSASSRPQNSLLEEFVEFDIMTRPAPVITEQTTLKLEDIIKQRIKDKAWDDVEKKFKPIETPLEYKKKLILNQEKSKESLSQIYENEYIKEKKALTGEDEDKEEEEPKQHTEIKEMMHTLFAKLDALSNFHYTPKMVKPEIKIISNVPAVTMEEVAPIATSDAMLLAPEEVKAKSKGDIIGKAERTKTDMKRERRRKKLKQRVKQKVKEENEKSKPTLKAGIEKKYKKSKTATELVKKLSKSRNVTQVEETSHKMPKSSTAFFTQLQDQVKSNIKSKMSSSSTKNNKHAITAKKLKL